MHFVAFVQPLPEVRQPVIDHEETWGQHEFVTGAERLTGRRHLVQEDAHRQGAPAAPGE